QRLLRFSGKQAFGFKMFFELLERELQSAQTHGFNVFDVNLVVAALFIDADGAAYGDAEAVLGTELHEPQLILEANATDLGAFVLESAVDVAGLGFVAIGDFALDEDSVKGFAKQVADFCGELADGEDAAIGGEVESELSSHGLKSGKN